MAMPLDSYKYKASPRSCSDDHQDTLIFSTNSFFTLTQSFIQFLFLTIDSCLSLIASFSTVFTTFY